MVMEAYRDRRARATPTASRVQCLWRFRTPRLTTMSRDLILGTAGHIDHGKTSLVKALTGIDCDRLPEEKQRGITIAIGFAHLNIGDVCLVFIGVTGREC